MAKKSKKKLKINENFLNNNIFLFNSYTCDVKKENIRDITDDETKEYLYVNSNSEYPIRFAFSPKVGLVRLNDDGSSAESNILGELLSINGSKAENYFSFFNRNGFLIPTSTKNYNGFEFLAIKAIIDRLSATLQLMSAITEISRTSYEKIVRMIIYLIFSPRVYLENPDIGFEYTQNNHPYSALFENALKLKRDQKYEDVFNNNEFVIDDSISRFTINAQLLDDIFNGDSTEDRYEEYLYKRAFHIYFSNREALDEESIQINDFLFRYFTEVGIVKGVTLDRTYYYNDELNKENFSKELKDAAIRVAKIILKYEIESNVNRIRASYDISKMEASWRIDSLLSALYFGLFYMRPSMETYRRCANSKCNKYFLVSLSSQHKKYCCRECQNREMQARKRVRDKIKQA